MTKSHNRQVRVIEPYILAGRERDYAITITECDLLNNLKAQCVSENEPSSHISSIRHFHNLLVRPVELYTEMGLKLNTSS